MAYAGVGGKTLFTSKKKTSTKSVSGSRSRYNANRLIMQLEPRIMFDAAAVATADATVKT